MAILNEEKQRLSDQGTAFCVWIEQKFQSKSICCQGLYSFHSSSLPATEGNGEPPKISDREKRVT